MSPQTRAECIASAGEAYASILADPESRERIRAHREATQTADEPLSPRGSTRARRPATTRKSA